MLLQAPDKESMHYGSYVLAVDSDIAFMVRAGSLVPERTAECPIAVLSGRPFRGFG